MSWRATAILLAIICCVQRWQACSSSTQLEHREARKAVVQSFAGSFIPGGAPSSDPGSGDPAPAKKRTIFGMRVPAWADRLLPQPGEKAGAYRDRIVPLAQIAIAPQRARVARIHDRLPEATRDALDAAVAKTGQAIEDRITQAVLEGELGPSTKPMQGVSLARQVLDLVDQGNSDFMGALSQDQRAQLGAFDFADYLVFARPWEDALARR